MALGEGFASAIKEVGLGDLGESLNRAFRALAEDLYQRLREDLIAEVRSEVRRVGVNEATTALAGAIRQIAPPIVQVEAPTVHTEVLPADVNVNVPKADAPKVTVEKKNLDISIVRGEDGKITGAKVKSHG
jgi:hypothetical protein